MKRYLVSVLLCLSCFSGFSQVIKVTTDTIEPQSISIIPEDIGGNWFRTDGSGDWAYGFHDKVAICDGEVYDVTGVTQVNRRYRIQIRNKDQERTLFIKLVLKGNLKIGTDPDKAELFSPEPVVKPGYVIPDDAEFQSPVLKRDTATIRGYLKGYQPDPGNKDQVGISNTFLANTTALPVKVDANGVFEVKIPMNYPQEVTLVVTGRYRQVFLVPGQSEFLFWDLSGDRPGFANRQKLLFMGNCARINTDLQAISGIHSMNLNELFGQAKKMTRVEFKDWCLATMNREVDSLNSFAQAHPVCRKALQIRRLTALFQAYQYIFWYDEARKTVIEMVEKDTANVIDQPGPDFFSFLQADLLNDQVSLLAGEDFGMIPMSISKILSTGLVSDITFSQRMAPILTLEERPFTTDEIDSIRSGISEPFIVETLMIENQKVEEKIAEEAKIPDTAKSWMPQLPDITVDQLFEAIIGEYSGKVIFIDFWATWCGPCKAGIRRMKSLKREYTGKDIVFLYITDPSSPRETWNQMIPDIKGYHYRLTKEQYQPINKRFNIKTIPRYMLIDKTGQLINDDLGAKAYSNDELRKVLDEALNK